MNRLSSSEAGLTQAVDASALLAQVLEWSALNTGTGNLPGLAAQAALLSDALASLPGEITLETPAPVIAIAADGRQIDQAYGQHLVLRVRPEAPQRVLLTGHMDTVFAQDSAFQMPQWIDAQTLGGPGVADMKGGIAVMLAALAAFESGPSAPLLGYDVMLNSDEETGSLSSAPLIARLAQGKLAALTYEPSALPDGTLAGARGGSGNYSVVLTGRSAHAGRNPQDGRNAVVAAAALALGLKAIERPGLAINPARIEGGAANNVVPDHAVLRFNIRPADAAALAHFESNFSTLCRSVQVEHEVGVHCHGGISRPPKPLDARALALFGLVSECGADLGQTIAWQRSGGVCDGNNIAACGVPVVDTLGVRGGAIHSPGEFLIVASLAERAALSVLVLHRLATGGLA